MTHLPSIPLSNKAAQGKCSRKVEMKDSALRRQSQGLKFLSAPEEAGLSCFKKGLWGCMGLSNKQQNQVPHVGQISNKFKIEQVLLREGVPTDAGG